MKFYLQCYIMISGMVLPIVLNNWLGLITNGTVLFVLGLIWSIIYVKWWENVWASGDLK